MWMPHNLHKVDTLIGPATSVCGDVEFTGGLHVEGRIAGDVRAPASSESTLSVSEHGVIEGAVEVANVILEGCVKGPIHARGRVVLGPKSRVYGDLYYGVIEMTLGAEITGKMAPFENGRPAGAGQMAKSEVKFG
jgi:cytoskeletal protein CcmA (bactofilin family)